MNGMTKNSASCIQYELEIEIAAPREKVWKAMLEETNAWWLPDFHQVAPDSVVTFDPNPGGCGLLEQTTDGSALMWYTVQMHLPAQFKIYLVGHLAPEWGGPSTSSMKLALDETDTGCVLRVTDALHGNVDEKSLHSTQVGWTQLFGEGLKELVENGKRQVG